ncbi:hypothetical protein, partial [uncultured Allobaculum sp.]|uniref:hypothetical protein n=1 Tax=uncultured Allobaculum sp. TaxID=1187017 RepID=UPI00259AF9C1
MKAAGNPVTVIFWQSEFLIEEGGKRRSPSRKRQSSPNADLSAPISTRRKSNAVHLSFTSSLTNQVS